METEETPMFEEFLQAEASNCEDEAASQTDWIPASLFTYDCNGVDMTSTNGQNTAEVHPNRNTRPYTTFLPLSDLSWTCKRTTYVYH